MKFNGARDVVRRNSGDGVSRQPPEAGALCGNSARRDLCGRRRVTGVPTATRNSHVLSTGNSTNHIEPFLDNVPDIPYRLLTALIF